MMLYCLPSVKAIGTISAGEEVQISLSTLGARVLTDVSQEHKRSLDSLAHS